MQIEIIRKIQKLLRLSKSSNEHEAALAAEKAQLLLAEHKVSMADLDTPEEEKEKVTHENFQPRAGQRRRTVWHSYIIGAVCEVTGVQRVWVSSRATGGNYIFIGKETDIAIAKDLCEWLIAQVHRFGASCGWVGKSDRVSFCKGCASTVASRLRKLHAKTVESSERYGALMVLDKQLVDTYTAKMFPHIHPIPTALGRANEAFQAGAQAGEKVALGGRAVTSNQ
jgi:hypothetical protein